MSNESVVVDEKTPENNDVSKKMVKHIYTKATTNAMCFGTKKNAPSLFKSPKSLKSAEAAAAKSLEKNGKRKKNKKSKAIKKKRKTKPEKKNKRRKRCSAYLMFLSVQSKAKDIDVTKLGPAWKRLGAADRVPYQRMADERNKREERLLIATIERDLSSPSPSSSSMSSKHNKRSRQASTAKKAASLATARKNKKSRGPETKRKIMKAKNAFFGRPRSKERALKDEDAQVCFEAKGDSVACDRVISPMSSSVGSTDSNEEQFQKGPFPSLDPDLVGLGWTESEYILDGEWYTVFTGPYGLRCRNLQKAREMAATCADLDITCCSPTFTIPKVPLSQSREGLTLLSTCAVRRLMARYTGRTPQQVKAWKHSKAHLIGRLQKFIDAAASRNIMNRDLKRKKIEKERLAKEAAANAATAPIIE